MNDEKKIVLLYTDDNSRLYLTCFANMLKSVFNSESFELVYIYVTKKKYFTNSVD